MLLSVSGEPSNPSRTPSKVATPSDHAEPWIELGNLRFPRSSSGSLRSLVVPLDLVTPADPTDLWAPSGSSYIGCLLDPIKHGSISASYTPGQMDRSAYRFRDRDLPLARPKAYAPRRLGKRLASAAARTAPVASHRRNTTCCLAPCWRPLSMTYGHSFFTRFHICFHFLASTYPVAGSMPGRGRETLR